MNFEIKNEGIIFKSQLNVHFYSKDISFMTECNIIGSDQRNIFLSENSFFLEDASLIKSFSQVYDVFKYYEKKLKRNQQTKEFHLFYKKQNNNKYIHEIIENSSNFFNSNYNLDVILQDVRSNIIKIDPYFFKMLLNYYQNTDEEKELFESLISIQCAMRLANKIKQGDNGDLVLIFESVTLKEKKEVEITIEEVANFNKHFFQTIYFWQHIDDEKNIDLQKVKSKISQIYLKNNIDLMNNNNNNYSEIEDDLNNLFELLLKEKSDDYLAFRSYIREQNFNVINKIIEIKTTLTRNIINVFMLLPISMYGLYLTRREEKSEFSIFSSEYNFIYVMVLIALIYLLIFTQYEVKKLNSEFNDVFKSLYKDYGLNYTDKNIITRNISCNDFSFQIITIVLFLFSIICILLKINGELICRFININ